VIVITGKELSSWGTYRAIIVTVLCFLCTQAYVTFHSYGQYILHPWGYARGYPSDHADLSRVGKKIANAMYQAGGATYTVGGAAVTLYPASGNIGPNSYDGY
jgi:hypothetical protein